MLTPRLLRGAQPQCVIERLNQWDGWLRGERNVSVAGEREGSSQRCRIAPSHEPPIPFPCRQSFLRTDQSICRDVQSDVQERHASA